VNPGIAERPFKKYVLNSGTILNPIPLCGFLCHFSIPLLNKYMLKSMTLTIPNNQLFMDWMFDISIVTSYVMSLIRVKIA
jgi:hypothetical protein